MIDYLRGVVLVLDAASNPLGLLTYAASLLFLPAV